MISGCGTRLLSFNVTSITYSLCSIWQVARIQILSFFICKMGIILKVLQSWIGLQNNQLSSQHILNYYYC